MAEPILTVTVSSGATRNDPSEDLLFELLSDIEAGREDSVVVDRRGHHETYAQVVLEQDGSFLMEHRAGSAQQHFAATSTDKCAIHAALNGWAFQLQVGPTCSPGDPPISRRRIGCFVQSTLPEPLPTA